MSKPDHSQTGGSSRHESSTIGDRIFYGLLVAAALLVVIDLTYHKHGHFDFELVLGFHAMFGFVSYLVIVNSAKLLRRLVKRREDYYDE